RLHLHRLHTLASQTRRTPTTQLFTYHREVNLFFYVIRIKHGLGGLAAEPLVWGFALVLVFWGLA
ncbi:MAG: hypothetical protein IJQ18_06805, partial [Paludibacteraceae bacterium]|nr:hypothetical protein [Paludibacteraceae bacterium]